MTEFGPAEAGPYVRELTVVGAGFSRPVHRTRMAEFGPAEAGPYVRGLMVVGAGFSRPVTYVDDRSRGRLKPAPTWSAG